MHEDIYIYVHDFRSTEQHAASYALAVGSIA